VHHVPEISAEDLHERIERGDKLVILDTRTPEEYQRFCIPGGRSMPGGELALRITDITKDLDEDTTVILNCAGRTRSITGTRVLQRMGIEALGLKNGTSGWLLAGFELENGGDLVELPEVSEEGRAAAEEYAAKLAAEDGVRYLSPDELEALMAKRDSQAVYLVDVRTDKEYTEGHIPGFRWWPGGQAVQRADDLAGVKNSTIVFCCDGRTRATVTGSLYRQMGHQEVYAVDGGASAWAASGRELSEGMERSSVAGLGDAFRSVSLVSAQDLNDNPSEVVLFVDTSQDFSGGHTPGAKWLSRSWLELEIGDAAHDKSTAITVTCATGRNSALAAVTLGELGYSNVSVLEGGMAKWREAGLPVEQGLTGIVRPPADINYLGVDRSYGEMMNYLRWETELGVKYAS
jgi:rhodanese-related sulfurtransferase